MLAHQMGYAGKSLRWKMASGGRRYCAALAAILSLFTIIDTGRAANVTVDGSQTFQTIDGFGVNMNHRSWTNNELQPAINLLVNQAGMTLFRVIYDRTDWETT